MSTDLLSRLQAATSDEEREWVVLEFSLENLEKDVRDAVWVAAIPHWFNEDFLAALLQTSPSEVKNVYERMKELSFVELFPGRGYNVHERTRRLLLQEMWRDSRDRYLQLSQRALDYCAAQNQDDSIWRVEWLYHLLIADTDDGIYQLQWTGWDWNNHFAYDKVETMSRAVREHANAARLTERGLAWTQFWEGLVELDYFRYRSAKERFLQINLSDANDRHLTAEVNIRLGDTYIMLDEYEHARSCYEEALPICRETGYVLGEVNCIKALGDVNYMLGQYDEARKRYEEALPICRQIDNKLGEASCIQAMSKIDYAQGQYDEAVKRCEQALAIYRAIDDRLDVGNCLQSIADSYQMLEKDEEARKQYEEARSIFEGLGSRVGIANCLLGIADLDQKNKRWKAAQENYEKALKYYQEDGLSYNTALVLRRLGYTMEGLKNVALARKYYQEALEIFGRIKSPLAKNVQDDLDSLSASAKKKSGRSKKSASKPAQRSKSKKSK